MTDDFKHASIRLAIGLGNPGKKYQHTFHNVGEDCAAYLAPRFTDIIFATLPCFMNESGVCAKQILAEEQLTPKNLVVFHDDSDLSIGQYKISFGQGSAGHNGVASLIHELGTKDFWRVRIGIRPEHVEAQAGDFVLTHIPETLQGTLHETYEDIGAELTRLRQAPPADTQNLPQK